MDAKRGQISAFAIIGIVLVTGALIFFVYRASIMEGMGEVSVPSEVVPVKVFVDGCLKKVGEEAVRENSLNGGYYSLSADVQSDSMHLSDHTVPLYAAGKDVKYPPKEKVGAYLAEYVKDNLKACLGDFSALKGFTVQAGDFTVKPVISQKEVIFELDYPMQANGYDLEKFSVDVKLAMGKLYGTASMLADGQRQAEMGICLTCYAKTAVENNIRIDYLTYGDNYIVLMKDLDAEKPYYFIYGIKPKVSSLMPQTTAEKTLMIEPVQSKIANVGQEFAYDLKVTDDSIREGVVFSDETELFDISADGKISFVPTEAQKGIHSVRINAEAGGRTAFEIFTLIIE